MQKYQVLVTDLAKKEIDSIGYYIEEASFPASADRVVFQIWKAIVSLDYFPKRGTKIESATNTWIISVRRYKYYIMYVIDENDKTVSVLHVIHQHQSLNSFIV